ncbi:biopolymer transporter ExbD [candidate division KSB1 bacterium]|nr:biopolymer transporter ExbD [candidate division KSB1 bacterium]
MDFQTNRKKILTFSAISLTDIVLLLLIFFLLSSSFIIQPGIKVKLPKAVSGQVEPGDRIILTITSAGSIFLNGEQLNLEELGAGLRQSLANHPEKLVVIKADRRLSLEKLVEVVDIAKLAGTEKFMIATIPEL